MIEQEEGTFDMEEGNDAGEPCRFFHKKKGSTMWWVDYPDEDGRIAVTFDKKRILNLYSDYPQKFTEKEREIFEAEDPYWAGHFGRK